jgi:hypothetical protein
MVVRTGAILVFKEQVQVADLIQQNGVVNDTSPINFIQLLNGVLLFQVKAKHCVELLALSTDTAD